MTIPRWTQLQSRLLAAHRAWLTGAALLTGVLGVSLFKAHGRSGPAAAVARDGSGPVTPAPGGTGDTASAGFQQWVRSPVAPIKRNLFYITPEQFPRAKAAPVADASGAAGAPGATAGRSLAGAGEAAGLRSENPDARAKSPAERSEDVEEPENDFPLSASDRFAREARRLHLQTVVTGPAPRAMIDGQLLGEGDVVANFRVLKIEARGITLEREGIRLELLFKQDLSR